jgi:hypothetical protein
MRNELETRHRPRLLLGDHEGLLRRVKSLLDLSI